ncbi:MAG: septation protein A [Gammaproteobacteria bacterium]|nr:MAG: septation protein A [Gammaproteobacteria bacterium]
MKAFTDFFPLILFFAAYQYTQDLIVATAVLIAGTVIQVTYLWIKNRRVEKMHLVTLVMVILFGGLTVALKDPTFIVWKPTVINWLFACVFLGSEFIGNKNIIQRMLESNLSLPPLVWRNLNMAWATFFFVAGALNIYVAFSFSQEFWVNFKVFGLLGLTLVFVIIQGLLLSRYISDESSVGENANKKQEEV